MSATSAVYRDTSSWTLDTLDEELRSVRNHYVEILGESSELHPPLAIRHRMR